MKKNCSICHKHIISGLGKGCKLCGMHLIDQSREFCSKNCRSTFNKIGERI
ncbi:MAG: hypothetical protein ISS01_02440 [Nanoarchaeota archaeon]|nr:hypothetical protein [Nanoarchaeota archaeon]